MRVGLCTWLAWLAAVTGACLSPAGCAHPAPSEPAANGDAGSTALLPPPAPPALDPLTRGWELGQWYAYPLKLTTAVSFGDGANAFDFDLTGVVQITPTSVTPASVSLFVAVASPKIVSRLPRSQPEFDKVAAQIGATGCFFTLSGGRISEMRAPRGLSPTAANTYREIASGLQFARPTQPADQYTAEEYDTTGQFVAEYAFDREQSVWHKRKRRYIAILAAKTAPAGVPGNIVPQIDKSEGDVRLLPDGRIKSVALRNTVTIDGAQQPVHSTTSLSLQPGPADPTRQPGPDWDALASQMARTGADEPYGVQASVESLDSARIGNMTFEKAVTRFEELAREERANGTVSSSINGARLDADEKTKQEQRTQEETRLFLALSAIFREQPQTIPRAVQRIRAKSPAANVLVEALSAASTPATQAILVELANSKATDAPLRDEILMSLSRTPRPDQKSVEALKKMLKTDPFSEQALLGLGTFSRRLRDSGDLDHANAIGELLVDQLRVAGNTPDRMTVLRAITNSGYAPALSVVIPFVTDGDEQIRVDAVRALQSMNDSKIDGVIADRLNLDSSSEVRISALGAAKVRGPTDVLAPAVENAANSASDAHVRFRAVELLIDWMPLRPAVRSTLERIANRDVEPRVRERAQQAL